VYQATFEDMTGSLCFVVRDRSARPLAGVVVEDFENNVHENNVIYYDINGLPGVDLRKTSGSGRVCLLNISDGPLVLSLKKQDQEVTSVLAGFAGYHQELSLEFSAKKSRFEAYPVGLVSPQELVAFNAKELSFQEYKSLTSADLSLKSVGNQQEMAIKVNDDGLYSNQRSSDHVLSQAGNSIPTLYRVPHKSDPNQVPVIPHLPHEFIADLAMEADLEWEAHEKGTLFVEYGYLDGQAADKNATQIKLVSAKGEEMTQFVQPASGYESQRQVFLNLSDGMYAVFVKSPMAGNEWLAADSAIIYPGIMTYVRTGAQILHPKQKSF
jgi:hypothetical protein